ncbi:Altered inheritance of mitochondria protein, mitochondrial [Lachnellula hyalina]|uniref:Altered inheritance of mitochondria protein, mitochondrial n=1 Tax=Lachnellula hyalina TaxID=1316788 RepID=A0A8H8R3V8_9HELO|nr:Altered inheritance of mitochondria protein, mitochondrial [Lachnellula hyalina]TVY27963.1 Altered inheritance of mitochondria protein, mitochondrial [Lachnellula hyalina]
MAMPFFRKQKDDGSEEEIPEEELYRYTRYRWLCNETENLAMRYRKFKVSALVDAAVNAVGDDATSCKVIFSSIPKLRSFRIEPNIATISGVKLLKCTEGQYNKAFLMTMDNGAEVLAKIPNPNAGPAFYTTASEVATRHFLRTVLKLPVPRIYAYSADPLNPVGSEYIIEEKAGGKPLGSLWYQWQPESRLDLVTQLVEFETKLASISFQRHGCIYYKKDLEKKGLPPYELEARSLSSDGPTTRLNFVLTEGFAFGPLTEARLWERERATMNLDRGPWNTPSSYMAAMGINEIQWATAYAKPQINDYPSNETPDSPEDYISLLERYLQLAPHLSPGPFRTSLSHPDLHLDNIFVDPDTKKITCIIDWQSASVSEPFFQPSIPRMLIPVGSCSPGERLEAALEKPNAREDSSGTLDLLSHYQKLSRLTNEQRWAAINLHNRSLLTEPVSLICGAWSRNDIFSFRHALIHVVARWNEVATASTPCPIQFTERELKLHSDQLELAEGLGEVLHQLQNDNLIPLGGMVLRGNYEQAMHINNNVRKMFIDMAESESQRILYSQIWPYQDRDS